MLRNDKQNIRHIAEDVKKHLQYQNSLKIDVYINFYAMICLSLK